MCASPLEFFRAGPPPPRVVLLPDALFFNRSVPVILEAAGEGATAPPGIASQVELALESLAPFPLAQLYYGFYWRTGASSALVFAAYRRRFTAEQAELWQGAELVVPTFAVLLGAEVEPATTLVLTQPDSLTVVHWAGGSVPSGVWVHPFSPEASEEERAQARQSLLRGVESRKVIDLTEPPAPQPRRNDREIVFASGDVTFRLPVEVVTDLDIRDKAELAQLRRAQKRDVILWRVAMVCVIAMGALALGEVGLFGGGLWLKARRTLLAARSPLVEQIIAAQEVANRINDLSTQRLLPIEMILAVSKVRPPSISFSRTSTSGLYTLMVDAYTPNAGDIGVFKNNLDALPYCASVSIKNPQTRDKVATFSLVAVFKPGGLKPAPHSP